jgi:hypothetical protein
MPSAIASTLRQLADGSWFDRQRVRGAAAILVATELAIFLFLVAGTHGWIVPLDRPTTTDFVSFYAAGVLADAGTPALAYDHAAHLLAEEQATAPGIEYQYFNYPPVFLLLCALLAMLPYLAAFMLFEGVTLAVWLYVSMRILGERSGTAVLALAAVPVVFWNFGLGQNAFLTAALFGAATFLIDRRPAAAGLLFGALCYKPQFGLLIPLALIAAGQWRAFAAAFGSSAVLVFTSLALFGSETWEAWLRTAASAPEMYQSGRILFIGMANPFGAALALGASSGVAYAVQGLAIAAAAAAVVAVWRSGLSLPTRAATLAAAAVIAAPLALLYDLMLAVVAAAWLVRDRAAPAAAAWEKPVIAALYPMLLIGRGAAEQWHVPVFPLVGVAVFAMAARRAWRELAARRAAASYEQCRSPAE